MKAKTMPPVKTDSTAGDRIKKAMASLSKTNAALRRGNEEMDEVIEELQGAASVRAG